MESTHTLLSTNILFSLSFSYPFIINLTFPLLVWFFLMTQLHTLRKTFSQQLPWKPYDELTTRNRKAQNLRTEMLGCIPHWLLVCRICGLKSYTILLGKGGKKKRGTQPIWAWVFHSCRWQLNSWGKGGQEVLTFVLQNREGKQGMFFLTPATSLHCSGSELFQDRNSLHRGHTPN